ncbi:hypothetical protein ACJX0J_027375 [Zea mays]
MRVDRWAEELIFSTGVVAFEKVVWIVEKHGCIGTDSTCFPFTKEMAMRIANLFRIVLNQHLHIHSVAVMLEIGISVLLIQLPGHVLPYFRKIASHIDINYMFRSGIFMGGV